MENNLENSFIIDLSNAKDTLQIINELSNILDMSESKEKNICLKLRDVELSQSQLLSIKALINATGSTLAILDIDNERTIVSAQELGITVSKINSNLEVVNADEAKNEPDNNIIENKEHEQNCEQEKSVQTHPAEHLQLPDFMNFEEITQENVDEIKQNAKTTVEPQFETSEQANVESELSYEIFKTEEIEEHKNDELPTLYLKQTLRSGQTLSYDGNILVIGDTHPGSELIAKGDITVWGVLGGIAHAGTSGDKNARIRALKLNGIQLRIAGIYAGRANTENIPFIQRSTEFTPQEARIENDMIVVRSIINNEV